MSRHASVCEREDPLTVAMGVRSVWVLSNKCGGQRPDDRCGPRGTVCGLRAIGSVPRERAPRASQTVLRTSEQE